MKLELHHFFILVKPEAKVAELLRVLGLEEGTGNRHEGQGTANRRFHFSNGMLEFLWVHDEKEADEGPGQRLRFSERSSAAQASPFGIILNRKDNSSLDMPFEGWKYNPVYFKDLDSSWFFHVGINSNHLSEPLCFYVPFVEPELSTKKVAAGIFKTITTVEIYTTSDPISDVLAVADHADRLSIYKGQAPLMEITFDHHTCGHSWDFRPDIPLIIHW